MDSKSSFAFRASVDSLLSRGQCYFWTFTFHGLHELKKAKGLWSAASRSLVRELDVVGVRCFEMHETHGLHIHAVFLGRYPLRLVRHIMSRYGFGRIHVMRVKSGGIGRYLTKYMAKGSECLRGMRKWAAIGTDKSYSTPVRSVQVTGTVSDRYRSLRQAGASKWEAFVKCRQVPIEKLMECGPLDEPARGTRAAGPGADLPCFKTEQLSPPSLRWYQVGA